MKHPPSCPPWRSFLREGNLFRVLVIVTAFLLPAITRAQEAPRPVRRALLVGVGAYANLAEAEQLAGSANDVAAMRDVLQDRFGFLPAEIKTLVDQQATGEGIRAAFRDLLTELDRLPAVPPAQVVFHFSGHGAQIADQPAGDPDRDEEDGLDETLVPADATRQGGAEDLRDDELHRFVQAVCRDDRARLLVVLDCCHSGTGARGSTRVRQLQRRGAAPASIPAPIPAGVESVAAKRLPDGAVFLSACRAREVEPEFQDGDKTYGLLTRFLVEVLSQQTTVSSLSYDLLRQAVAARYQQDRRLMQPPTPQLEGRAETLRTTVLGAGRDADRPDYWEVESLASARGQAVIRGGRFHQLHPGSLLELYERPEDVAVRASDSAPRPKSLAWLRVVSAAGAASTAEALRPDAAGELTPCELPAEFKRGVAALRSRAAGDRTLKVRVVRALPAGGDGPPLTAENADLPRSVAQAFAAPPAKDEAPWLEIASAPDAAHDLLLRIAGDQAALFPATGMSETFSAAGSTRGATLASLRGGWGPIDLRGPEAAAQVRADLRRVARARNLLSLAAQADPASSAAYGLNFELLSVRVNAAGEITSSTPWPVAADGARTMRSGDLYAVRVRHASEDARPVFVTVLLVDPDLGIEVVMPFQEGQGLVDDLKLEPGEQRTSDAFECGEPFGRRQAVLLATREPHDFTFLAQPELTRVRGREPSGGALGLRDLLVEETYFRRRGDRRVRPKTLDHSWHAQILGWQGVP